MFTLSSKVLILATISCPVWMPLLIIFIVAYYIIGIPLGIWFGTLIYLTRDRVLC